MRLTIGILFLVLFAIVLIAISMGLRFLERQRRKQVSDVLTAVSGDREIVTESTILRPDEQDRTAVEELLSRTGLSASMRAMIQQAGLNWTPASLVTAIAVAGLLGALIGLVFRPLPLVWINPPVFGGVFATIPLIYMRVKRGKRLHDIEEQLPEALDFLARSMRAGHAFSISLSMVGQEVPGALGQELRTLFNELNLGSPIETAMNNLTVRVPLLDIKLMASSILLQRQTGGNLSEVLTRLAFIIRERFRLRGQIRAASSHGRITAMALTLMPAVMIFLLPIFAPGYLQGLIADPDGVWLLAGAAVAQVLGYFIMRKITDIKV